MRKLSPSQSMPLVAERIAVYTANQTKACEKLLANKSLEYADIEGSTHRLVRDKGMPAKREEISKVNGFILISILRNQMRN